MLKSQCYAATNTNRASGTETLVRNQAGAGREESGRVVANLAGLTMKMLALQSTLNMSQQALQLKGRTACSQRLVIRSKEAGRRLFRRLSKPRQG